MAAFRKVFSNRPFIGSVLFVLSLYLLEEWLFGFPQERFIEFAAGYFSQPGKLIVYLSTTGSLALSLFFVWAALKSSRGFQVLYILLFTLSSLVQYGYWKALGRFVLCPDLRIAAATPLDDWEGARALFFDWRFVLPVIGFVVLLFVCSERQNWRSSLVKFGALFFSIVVLNFSYTFTDDPLNLGVSLPSFYQTIARFALDEILPTKREMLSFRQPGAPQNNIVLVIDESIRGDHLGINGYGRDTVPFLSSLAAREGFHNFGLAVAGATCSYPSNALLLTGVRPGFDVFESSTTYPTIFQYAKAMGYRTYYMDAQANSFWNGLTDGDVPFIDVWLKAADFGYDLESDFRAADRIAQIVSEGEGNFIVLNKRGVHFLYETSYPSNAAVWLPLPDDYPSHPELVPNSYDNGILYNVNTFFERLLANPQILANTAILYTSDHGQTLFENHVSWLHCNYTPQEAMVPLILLGRNLPAISNNYTASHSNIFSTLLDLMGVPRNERLHSYAPSLFAKAEEIDPDRFFFDGSLHLIDLPDP